MPGDPYRIFREAGGSKQEILKTLWADLYEALMPPPDAAATRQIPCPICRDRYPNEPAPIVARLTRNGHPACRQCIDNLADRPGGWPLKLLSPGETP